MHKINFQTKAQDELVSRATTLLSRPGRSVLTLQAPTGAGKTVMMANALSTLTEACEGAHRLAILWVAPNKLHEQSYARLQQVYAATKTLTCLKTEELAVWRQLSWPPGDNYLGRWRREVLLLAERV